MMRPAGNVQVYLCREFIDFRKGITGLTLLVEQGLQRDPFAEALYVFCNKARNRIKVIYWEKNGFCLWQKRIEREHFKWPRHLDQHTVTLNGKELNWLLDGFDLWANIPHKSLKYTSVA
jgi:transposase